MPEPDDTTAMLAAIARLRALITRNPIDFMAIHEATADEQRVLIQALTGIAARLIEEHAAAPLCADPRCSISRDPGGRNTRSARPSRPRTHSPSAHTGTPGHATARHPRLVRRSRAVPDQTCR
jgi:hypothetical protein